MELDHTLKRKIVPDNMIYKCVNIQKKLELGKYLFQGSNRAIQHRVQIWKCQLLGYWELACAWQSAYSANLVDHNGSILIQVWVQTKLWKLSQSPYVFRFQAFSSLFLADSTFGFLISSSILKYCVCMSD
jgi:hypothetical protein